MNRITLTGQMIADLAEFAGITFDDYAIDMTTLESEFTIQGGPAGVKNDDDTETFYPYFVHCNECPDEGGIGLGKGVEPPAPIAKSYTGDPDDQQGVRDWLNANPDAEASDGGRLG